MAAQVPAKDVLCEAMEYLSKLGSNLRTRSENLREKKIRREKLNNVLAVQKAASKVLLICELSKKSLQNVETGVRKVLELIDASQASSSDGGKRSKSDTDSESTSKYFFFEYKSRKLRIKKRISLKHYTSVRVIAKSIPKSMMDNYPVHYDCKLYRMRKREKKMLKLKDVPESHIEIDAKKDPASPQIEKDQSNDNLVISITDKLTSTSDKNVNKRKSVESQNHDMSVISIQDSPTSKSVDENDKDVYKWAGNPDKEKKRKSSVESVNEGNHSKDQSQQKTELENCDGSEKQKSIKRDKYSNEKRKFSEEKLIEHTKNSEAEDSQNAKKKFRKLRVIDDSSDDEKESNKKQKVEENIEPSQSNDSDESYHEPDHKKRKLNDEVALELSVDDEKNKEHDDNTVNESKKPLIKCVSLSKLLKPDAIKKNIVKPISKASEASSKYSEKKTNSKEVKAKLDRKTEKISRKEIGEEEYWKLKRIEVSSFKPKSFVINLTRLPELSLDYLNKLNLRKITKGGVTILEAIDKNSDEQDAESGDKINFKSKIREKRTKSYESRTDSNRASLESSNSNDDELIAEANKVKNSLLCESDSDENGIGSDTVKSTSTKEDNDKIKAAVRNYSVETKKSDDKSQSVHQSKDSMSLTHPAEKAKSALSNKSNSESDKNETKSSSPQAKKIKNKLLRDSNSDTDSKMSEAPQDIKVKKTLPEQSDSNNSDSKTNSPKCVYKSDSESGNNKTDTENGVENKSPADDCHIENNSDDSEGPKNTQKTPEDSEKKDENLAECQRNEKTPEKVSLPPENSIKEAKSSLLNDSPDHDIRTPLSQRMTPQSRKKRMRESMHAKKMLLTYSSSDTEDEKLKEALKEIKDSLLHVSDEENSSQEKKRQSTETSISSSDTDILKKVKKKILSNDSSSSKEKKHKLKKHRRRLNSQNSTTDSDNSKLSSSKMVRSKSKPGNSSSQNSDAQDLNDKDIDGLTNLNKLIKTKTRRRNSDDSEMTEESGSSKAKSPSLKTGLICEEMLKAESSSDSPAASGEENQDEDYDLPEVTLPSFNGDAGDHLVKEDLLGDSDSSASHSESAKKDNSDDEEKLNSKRRKANAISSDSEVGSSRKKDADVRLSDFEDSDDSDVTKRTKKKKKATDSDASGGSNSSTEGGKKKRRRIKSVRDSDASGSESETEGRNKHGRKNIRKVMGKNQLEEATKKAAREEKERIARIAERQKMYNNLEFDESGKPDEVVLDKVVLDFDPETKEPLIEVDRGLVKKLKPHQANGIKFMWDACFESAKRIKKDRGSGCILAHCMGLGKTLQVVTLTHTLLTHGDLTRVNRVLVVCPLSTVLNWVNEFKMWLKYAETEYEVDVYELSRFKQNSERAFQLSQWFQYGGVCVLGYEMFRNLSADNSKKFKKKMLKSFQEALVDPGPDLVVCDEGHLLKNEKTSLSQSMNRVKTHRRIVLTGTPLQNNLKEYYCMVQFVKPNLLGKYNEYLNRFVNPITNGQYTDSTEHDIKIMKRRSHVLHKMLDGAVQRRDYGVLAPFLPPKHEYVLFITLSEVQTKLYQHYLDNFSRRPQPGKSSGFLFPDFQSLQRIWTHPLVLKYNSERYEIMQQKKRDKEEEDSEGSLVDFIDDDSTPDESTTEESTDDSSELSDDSRKKSKKKKSSKKSKGKDKDKDIKGEGQSRPRRGTRANPIEIDDDLKEEDNIVEARNENPTEWWIKLVVDEELDDMRNSHKLVLLFDILRQCETIGDKLLVFSQSLYSLDLIEHFLGKVDEATQEGRIDEKLGGHVGSWSPGVDYFRLDGSTSCENRSIWCKNFNREDNPRARLFLISTRAGGLGINLVAANRVVIFDVSWNPSHDVQSIFRVYRFGQKKPCYVYRFLAMGTMEEKIYERQVTKQAISKRVIDEQQIDRHYAENDLAELYKFEPQPPSPRPIPPLPKDRLFAEMLREHEPQIYKYHEHDSLLENKEEETLSEEERKAAWEDFENEKNKPPPAPFPSAWPMHNGMVPGLLAQQQQLAYAALAAMLRKDMPNLNDNQLRDMLPLIYNANPQMFGGYDYGLMQKMSELYKYTQPGMMNPGMMNPGMMNAAGGAGALGALGGASGLQYEPPWQRQQQQQQQMRLQQMMQQQQNQMGAKFYAGGLGSRDPVAMALQQQRAREIMLGNAAGAGRPRGRPPLQPRAPAASDVVNLDSD